MNINNCLEDFNDIGSKLYLMRKEEEYNKINFLDITIKKKGRNESLNLQKTYNVQLYNKKVVCVMHLATN
jgi:hypothetical protein